VLKVNGYLVDFPIITKSFTLTFKIVSSCSSVTITITDPNPSQDISFDINEDIHSASKTFQVTQSIASPEVTFTVDSITDGSPIASALYTITKSGTSYTITVSTTDVSKVGSFTWKISAVYSGCPAATQDITIMVNIKNKCSSALVSASGGGLSYNYQVGDPTLSIPFTGSINVNVAGCLISYKTMMQKSTDASPTTLDTSCVIFDSTSKAFYIYTADLTKESTAPIKLIIYSVATNNVISSSPASVESFVSITNPCKTATFTLKTSATDNTFYFEIG
jgi:hypothetical protein